MKKILIVILCAVSLGGGAAFYLFNKIVVKEDNKIKTVNAFQIGAFTKYENAERVAARNNGIVVSDNDIYRVYVAILNDQEAILKLKNYYAEIGLEYYLKEIEVNEEYILSISSEEELLKKSDSETYVTINNQILKKYEELL